MKIISSSPEIAKAMAQSKEIQTQAVNTAERNYVQTELATHERDKHELNVASNIANSVQKVGSALDIKA